MALAATGTKLGYKATEGASTFTDIDELLEVPEFGGTPEKIDVTTLKDTVKKSVPGVIDYGDLAFRFIYDKAVYQAISTLTGPIPWQLTLPDGVKFDFTAIPSARMAGVAVNGALTFAISMDMQSEIVPTFPT
jgi:hypothetical protein